MANRKVPGEFRRVIHCATMEEHEQLAYRYPEYRRRQREIEYETRRLTARVAAQGLRTGVVRIPVVVHFVTPTLIANPLARAQSQIAALNADFRATNPDIVKVPAVFAGVVADTRIEFALAVRDPNCAPTQGIVVVSPNSSPFTVANRNHVKSAATGGANPWPSDRYLNMWVTEYLPDSGNNLLGFATFPGSLSGSPQLDGVVIDHRVFGTIGATAPFNLGRTATHEVGHWLNLIHIWGTNGCGGDDACVDTPLQDDANLGVPIPGVNSCGNASQGGDMYMNYMDYVNDAEKFMFTADQAMRMNAALSIERNKLLGSDGLIPPNAPTTPDLWIQGVPDDIGDEPYTGPGSICDCDDIWIRNNADGLTVQDHQNPLAEQPNMVYVRVRNRGCPAAGVQTGTLRLYWAKASPSLSWPAPWDGLTTSPALMGQPIGSANVSVAGGAQQIYAFPWTPPDPSDYAMFGADKAHFCLLARIETAAGAGFGMTFPETSSLDANVRNNNNIAWKNIAIVDSDGPFMFVDVVLAQYAPARQVARYTFETPKGPGPTVFDWGFLIVEARGKALAPWRRPDLGGEGFQRLDDGRLLIMKPGAWIAAPPLKRGQAGTLHIRFVPDERRPIGARVLDVELTERDSEGLYLGGQHLRLKTGKLNPPATPGKLAFDGVDWAETGVDCGCRSG